MLIRFVLTNTQKNFEIGHSARVENPSRFASVIRAVRSCRAPEAAPTAMSRAAKSVVFAGEDSEGEESDDDEWLDDVEDTPRAGDAPERNEAAGAFLDSPSGTPRASQGDAGSRDGDATTTAGQSATAAVGPDAAVARMAVDAPDGGAKGPFATDDTTMTTRRVPSDAASSDVSSDVARGGGDAGSRRAVARIDTSTRAQRRLAQTAQTASELLRRKHVAGKELGATFLESTGTALQETSMSVQQISNAMRRLQGNLWQLAATGTQPWRRVPNSQRVPRDVYEKYKRRKDTEQAATC